MSRPVHITDEDRAVLDFERLWWKYPGAKDAEIMERFGLTATRYYQRLNALIDEPAAEAHDAQLVRRLRRQRDRRRQARRADSPTPR